MIARHWRGYARDNRARDYGAHLREMMIDYDRRVVHYEVLEP